MISYEQIDQNVETIKAQLDKFIGFDNKTAFSDNNKNWLADLNYIDFLRDIGSCFSVNKMLSFEAYKQRLERGLSFIEFNYQLLQSYDYLQLHQRHNVCLQIGGDDQWGNITAEARRNGRTQCRAYGFRPYIPADYAKRRKKDWKDRKRRDFSR